MHSSSGKIIHAHTISAVMSGAKQCGLRRCWEVPNLSGLVSSGSEQGPAEAEWCKKALGRRIWMSWVTKRLLSLWRSSLADYGGRFCDYTGIKKILATDSALCPSVAGSRLSVFGHAYKGTYGPQLWHSSHDHGLKTAEFVYDGLNQHHVADFIFENLTDQEISNMESQKSTIEPWTLSRAR
jgi:hypothetical protein